MTSFSHSPGELLQHHGSISVRPSLLTFLSSGWVYEPNMRLTGKGICVNGAKTNAAGGLY